MDGHLALLRTKAAQRALTVIEAVFRWALRLGLPVIGAVITTRVLPYRGSAAGVPFRVHVTAFRRPGFSLDTTFGNWEFPHVIGMPVGIHVSPENVDLIGLTAANQNTAAFAERLRADFEKQIPEIAMWVVGEIALGVLAGLAFAAGINMAVGYLHGRTKRPDELRYRAQQLAAALVVVSVVVTYAAVSYNPHWARESRTTGTLGALQLFPDQLKRYYTQQSKASDVLGAVVGIQATLQQRIEEPVTPPTAVTIMHISDMHLAATYPLLTQYAQNFGVNLIINTGDETAFGQDVEITPSYRAQLEELTTKVPMIWVAGNHDSPGTVATMRTIKGVTVLGTKTKQSDGSYTVTADEVEAFGLRIAGAPDPRVYGAVGVYGSDKDADTDALQRQAMDGIIATIPDDAIFDIFATHEPAAADRLREKLRIRQTNAGHTHRQNDDLYDGSTITLVEGSTGAGGLDAINRDEPPPPVEFSIESVASDCQFTKVIRFQIPKLPVGSPSTFGSDVTASTTYLRPQKVAPTQYCGSLVPMSQPTPVTG